MLKPSITEAEILDVLLGDADPRLEARVRQAVRHDPRLAILMEQWRGVIPPLRQAAAPLQALNARVREGVLRQLGDQPLAAHFLVDGAAFEDDPRPRRRLRRRFVALAVAALLLAGLCGPATLGWLWPAIHAGRVSGQIRILHADGSFAALRPGERLGLPLRLQAAPGAEAELELADRGSRLRLAGVGEVAIEGRRTVRQISGQAAYRVAPSWLGGRFTVQIPQGAVEDLGTEFKVTVSGAERSVVQVSEGRVRINQQGGRNVEARAGERAVVAPAATVVEPVPVWTDLAQARAHFTTRLTRLGPAPQDVPLPPPPPGARELVYHSGGLRLRAWVSDAAAASGATSAALVRRPAVVFAHADFSLTAQDWDLTAPFRRAGFIVVLPLLRGERGNPGNFEAFWGEVDDLVAAGDFAAALPAVEPAQVFLAGAGEGGTLAALAALLPSRFAAAATVGAAVDLASLNPGGRLPFDPNVPGERMLRSPCYFPESIRCPLHLILGDADAVRLPASNDLAREAAAAGKPCQVWIVKGDVQAARALGIEESVLIFKDLLSLRRE